MSEQNNERETARGWTISLIAKYVASFTGVETPISLVWNWQKRTETLNKGDRRRFPDPIGTDDKGQKVFNPLEVIEWLQNNDKISAKFDIHPDLWRLVNEFRGTTINTQVIELILDSFLNDGKNTSNEAQTKPDLTIPTKNGKLQIEVKEFRQKVKQFDRRTRKTLLEELQRFFLADKLHGAFHTPQRLATLAARLLNAQPGSTVYDPCAGTGRLLAAVADEANKAGSIRLVGKELNELTSRLGNAMISVSDAAPGSGITCGDSLTFDPQAVGIADAVISHYPLRTKINPEEFRSMGRDPRFVYTKPTTSGDVAWIQVLLAALKPTGGRAVVIGSLFLTSHRQSDKLRDALLRRRHIEAVVTLAKDRQEYGNGLPPTLLLLDTDPERGFRRKQVLFVDVAATNDSAQAQSADEFVIQLVKAHRAGELSDSRAQHPIVSWRVAHHQEIAAKKNLLSPSSYLDQLTQTSSPDDLEERIRSLSRQLAATRRQLHELESKREDSK